MSHLRRQRELLLSDEDSTKRFAALLAKSVEPPLTVGLVGDLGAGKTTLIRYFVEFLGSDVPVSSPTYVLQHEYSCGEVSVDHWDLYRVSDIPDELLGMPPENCVRLIEWADRFSEVRSALDIEIILSADSLEEDFERRKVVVFVAEGSRFDNCLAEFDSGAEH